MIVQIREKLIIRLSFLLIFVHILDPIYGKKYLYHHQAQLIADGQHTIEFEKI